MPERENLNPENSQAGGDDRGLKKEKNVDRVVEELKNLLSGMNNPAPAKPASPPPPPSNGFEIPDDFPIGRNPLPPPAPINIPDDFKIGADPLPEATPAQEPVEEKFSPNPSDAAFWKGDVLGWSNATDEPPMPEPVLPDPALKDPLIHDTAIPEPPSYEPPSREARISDPVIPEPAPLQPLDESAFGENIAPGSIGAPVDESPPLPPASGSLPKSKIWNPSFDEEKIDLPEEPPVAPPIPQKSPPTKMSSDRLFANPFGDFLGDLPEPPPSPLEADATLRGVPSKPEEIPLNPNIVGSFHPSAVPDPILEKEPQIPSEPEEPLIPIPRSITKKPMKLEEPVGLELEGESMKPEGLVQIACIFPEGSERAGQQFLSKLKEICGRCATPLNVQPVFIHPWKAESVDLVAWSKSALLSGADLMFILSTKQDRNIFNNLATVSSKEGLQSRLLLVEQIELRTLYADVLVEMRRSR